MPNLDYAEYAALYPEFIEQLANAKQRSVELRTEVEAATSRSHRRATIHRYLTSFDVRLHALYQGVRDTKQFHRFPPSILTSTASSLDMFSASTETVRRTEIIKNGKRRRLISFGPRARARQQIAADVLRVVHQPHPNQFTLRGGVTGAIHALEQAFRDGFVYGQEVDVTDFFPSIHLDGLVDTLRPLPRAVVENVVWSRITSIRSRRRNSSGARSDTPPPPREYYGLALGSVSSPIAADIVMGEVLAGLPQGSRFVCFADNVMMLGETESRVTDQVQAFQTLLREHSTGPLGLRPKAMVHLGREIVPFLGYEGLCSPLNDRFDWTPRQAALDAIDASIEQRTASRASVYDGLAWLRQWQRGYPLWEDGNEWVPRQQFQLLAKWSYWAKPIAYGQILRAMLRLLATMPAPVSLEELMPPAPPVRVRTTAEVRRALLDLIESSETEMIIGAAASD